MSTTDDIRCVCAAALERARQQYGHLAGHRVWVNRAHDDGAYLGTLHIPDRRPGYLWISRGGGDPDRSFHVHIDDVTTLTPDARTT